MISNRDLVLPDSFEGVKTELGSNVNKMMEFFVPIDEAETELTLISNSIKNSGKLVLMHGVPGVGKSTFIQSLKWRNHINIREIFNIDATDLNYAEPKLPQLLQKIINICTKNDVEPTSNGVVLFVIDYLETLSGENPDIIKAFFTSLNGILRQTPIMIIWPVTEESDVNDIKNYISAVSRTLFYKGKEVIYFQGPPKEKFPQILKNTISALNTGYTFNDFQLIDEDFDELLSKLSNESNNFTLREYIFEINQLWMNRSGKIEKILKSIPKQTEIWFVFSMPEAEQLVTQFVRKSKNIEDCWDAYHSKLDEYIHGNQKESYWTSQRLQIAISGSFKAKIFYMPTNALVSCLAAYGKEFEIDKKIDWKKAEILKNWENKSTASRFLKNSPLIKQLNGEQVQFGSSRSGRAKESIENARAAFEQINAISCKYNVQRDGSDKPFNKAIASALVEIFPKWNIQCEKPHPWLPNIIPDITVEKNNKLICLEFCYTKRDVPSAIADYVLIKLDNYMRQFEGKYPDIIK